MIKNRIIPKCQKLYKLLVDFDCMILMKRIILIKREQGVKVKLNVINFTKNSFYFDSTK